MKPGWLKAELEAREWTSLLLAVRLSVSVTAVEGWVNGSIQPRRDVMGRIRRLFMSNAKTVVRENALPAAEESKADQTELWTMSKHKEARPSPESDALTGERIKAERKARRWSAMELALRAGCSDASVYNWEAGKANPSRSKRASLYAAFQEMSALDPVEPEPEPEDNDDGKLPSDELIQEPESKPTNPKVWDPKKGNGRSAKDAKDEKEFELPPDLVDLAAALMQARASGDPKWLMIIRPARGKKLIIDVCARPEGKRK